MNANSHPIKTVSVADEGFYANNHPYKVVVKGGSGGNIGKVVDTLPEVGEPGFIYLVLKKTTKAGDVYDEYLWAQQPDESFAWEHLGATSEVTIQLYSTYGQNEDGAMTQKATTDLVYTAGDPKKINIGDNGVVGGTNSIIIGSEDSGTISSGADNIAIGHNITEAGNGRTVAIGHNITTGGTSVAIGASVTGFNALQSVGIGFASKPQMDSVAIGYLAKNVGVESVAIGNNTQSYKEGIAIGHDASALSPNSIAIGHTAGIYGNMGEAVILGHSAGVNGGLAINSVRGNGVSIGKDAITNTYGVAIGNSAGADTNNQAVSVALGAFSKPRAQGVVDVSTGSNNLAYQGVNDVNRTPYRLISGVHDGEELHDVATVAQGNTLSTTAPTTTTVGVLGQLYTDTTNMHTYQLTAIDTTDPANPVYNWTQRW